MGQNEVLVFLKNHPNKFFSAGELGRLLNINIQSSKASLNRLKASKDVSSKIEQLGKTNNPVEFYSYRKSDDSFEEAYHQFKMKKGDGEFAMANSNYLLQLMMLSELKKIREVLENVK